jgi:hypothetical protein
LGGISNEIASGINASIIGGNNNTISVPNINVQSNSFVAGGTNNTITNYNGFVTGVGNTVSGENQTVIGQYNVAGTDYLFAVGNGTSSARHNAFTVNKDNSITIGNTTVTEAKF